MTSQLEHWMMFSTFAEQNHFIYPKNDTYNGVVFNANMAAHAPSGLAEFIIGKLDSRCRYMIDPITHAFQHDPKHILSKNGELKSSIASLAEAYGEPITTCCASGRRVTPQDVSECNLDDFVRRVIDFQRNHLREFMMNSDMAKYLDKDEMRPPAYIVSPYFFMNDTNWTEWIQCNIDLAEASLGITKPDENILLEIVLDKGILESGDYDHLIHHYESFKGKVYGCILWIDDLDEERSSKHLLTNFKDLCMKLHEMFGYVLNLHGGYFSVLLGSELGIKCLGAVTHGPEFGEHRSVVPVGGGIPLSKYYIPDLHIRANFRTAADWFESAGWLQSSQKFHDDVCDCDECRRVINGNADNFVLFDEGDIKDFRRGNGMVRIKYPSQDTKLRCLRHYLQKKSAEFDNARTASSSELIKQIDQSIQKYETIVGYDEMIHLLRWKSVLSESLPKS